MKRTTSPSKLSIMGDKYTLPAAIWNSVMSVLSCGIYLYVFLCYTTRVVGPDNFAYRQKSARAEAGLFQRHLQRDDGSHHEVGLVVIDGVLPDFRPADALAELRQGQRLKLVDFKGNGDKGCSHCFPSTFRVSPVRKFSRLRIAWISWNL